MQVVNGDEMKSLQRFPGLQAKILATIDTSLDEYRRKSRDFAVHLVKMEGSLIIPQLFKMADENFGEDKRDMGPDAEWAMVRPANAPRLFSFVSLLNFCCLLSDLLCCSSTLLRMYLWGASFARAACIAGHIRDARFLQVA